MKKTPKLFFTLNFTDFKGKLSSASNPVARRHQDACESGEFDISSPIHSDQVKTTPAMYKNKVLHVKNIFQF